MADMVELSNSNGESATESESTDVKQNGDVNGSCTESAMEVDEVPVPVVTKKVVNNEIVNSVDTPEEENIVKEGVKNIPEEKNGNQETLEEDVESAPEENKEEGEEEDDTEKMDVDETRELSNNNVNDDEKQELEDGADPLGGDDASQQSSEPPQTVEDEAVDEDPEDDEEDEVETEDKEKSDESKEGDLEEKKSEKSEQDVEDVTNGDDSMEVDGEKKLNGSSDKSEVSEDLQGDKQDDNENTPKKGKKTSPAAPLNLTPRRSSRNLNKSKSYMEKDEKDIVDLIDDESPVRSKKKYDDDIQEISAVDPLADTNVPRPKPRPIILSDSKRLLDIAQGSKVNQMSNLNKGVVKKEPTVVIIDTNSILSGRGPIPVAHSTPQTINLHRSPQLTMMPVQNRNQNLVANKPAVPNVAKPAQPPILLPSLTDDMFVVEAPSFIVPYVYEKPPVKPLKEFVDDLDKTIKKEKEESEKAKIKKETEDRKKEEEEKKKDEEEKKSTKEEDQEMETKTDEEKEEIKEETTKEEDKDKVSEEKDKEDAKVDVKEEVKTEEKEAEVKKESDKPDVGKLDDATTKEEEKKPDEEEDKAKKSGLTSYFENPLGKFFMLIGINLVQEHVQSDLLKSHKRKREREGPKVTSDTLQTISSLTKTLELSKENNDPFRFDTKKCEYCNFKTESQLVMAHHLETPHMKNYIYRCNFCPLEVRSPHDIMFHMEAEHNVRGRLEKAPAFHQCPSCLFEDNQKGKLTRHLVSCAKKYRPERNQEPPLDWEPPAKIPRVSRNRPNSMSPGNAVYQAAMSGLKQGVGNQPQQTILPKMMQITPGSAAAAAMSQALLNRQRGRPLGPNPTPGLLYRPSGGSNAQNSLMMPPQYQIQAGQLFQQQNKSSPSMSNQSNQPASKLLNQPSISITPLPRQQPTSSNASPLPTHAKPGRPQQATGGKNTFVICEICDGYIKDLEQLRNHMQWIHKVKIHPKMIYNRPPLNCQKCQFRFFTDQGLERHLLGSHGLVTSSMQEAANKGKDGGRCPVCGRVYQWKLLNHVARDHNMQLKPAHLSYKCTVCTATFGMYRQFETHVYSAHSVAPKKPTDKKMQASSSSSSNENAMRPLKINDEITIIPQPPRPAASAASSNKVKITPVPPKK